MVALPKINLWIFQFLAPLVFSHAKIMTSGCDLLRLCSTVDVSMAPAPAAFRRADSYTWRAPVLGLLLSPSLSKALCRFSG